MLRRAGPSIFVTHSFGTLLGLTGTDECPDLVKGHVAYEGDQQPFQTVGGEDLAKFTLIPSRPYGLSDTPLAYDPPITDPSQLKKVDTVKAEFKDGKVSKYPCKAQEDSPTSRPRKLVNIAKSPILFLTGQGSIHNLYDGCEVAYLQQAGVKVKYTLLESSGVLGNGHYGMLEKNSDAIAKYIGTWLKSIEK